MCLLQLAWLPTLLLTYTSYFSLHQGGTEPPATTLAPISSGPVKLESGIKAEMQDAGIGGGMAAVAQQGVIASSSGPPNVQQQQANPSRKSTLPVHALVHAFHCSDE